jgi:hypothetical protein
MQISSTSSGALLAATLLALASCGGSHPGGANGDGGAPGGDGGAVACLDGLRTIALTPADQTATLDGGTAAPVTFTAMGTFADGHTSELQGSALTWTATRTDDTPPGTIANGVLAPFPSAGGVVTITATDGCQSGSTTMTFVLDVTVGTPSGDPGAWDGAPVTTGAVPTIVYPSDQTRFPRNIYRTLFQWRSQGYTEFRQTFAGAGATVTIYTSGADPLCAGKTPAAACWEADEQAWSFIAGSNAGGTVTWTVDALDHSTMPATIRRGAPITIGFSRRDVTGAIFYWSTTSAGVRRANIADAQPEDYIAGKPGTVYPDNDKVKCVACHVVSRDGKYLAAPVDATSGQSLWITEVTAAAPPTPLVKHVDHTSGHGFATFSPDDAHLVASWAGKLWMIDRETGSYIADLPLGAMNGTQPDWSPSGDQLVFATAKGDAPGGASLALIPYAGASSWGTPSVLVAAAGGLSNLFPMFSPDGNWIAFSRGKGGHGDLTAQLYVVPAGGGAPVELQNANRVVSNLRGDGKTENTQPTWAPPGDLDWVAFNSQREYGVVSPGGTQQIWVSAVDTSKAATGDPSYPAFRLQFQGLTENNHRAYWTLDVRTPPPPGTPDAGVPPPADAGMCIAHGAVCTPGDSCCEATDVCDSDDNGATYHCAAHIIP